MNRKPTFDPSNADHLRPHPIYQPFCFNENPSIRSLLLFGLAAERFKTPTMVTLVFTKSFTKAILASKSPIQFVTKAFHNCGLSWMSRVGVLEYGRVKNPDDEASRGPYLHCHMIIDLGDMDEKVFREILRKLITHGRTYDPPHDGGVIHIAPYNCLEYLKKAPRPLYTYEFGTVGWLLYAAKNARSTYEFLNLNYGLSARQEIRFAKFRSGHTGRLRIEDVHFPKIIFADDQTRAMARALARAPSYQSEIEERIAHTASLHRAAREALLPPTEALAIQVDLPALLNVAPRPIGEKAFDQITWLDLAGQEGATC